ncbi:hypothetical protein [Mariniphaga sp.]|uniref:hypothetical protein n=1 Tax=Mariniphaga sp. TaxID=1954475 RepID=UPI0035633CDD
MKITAPADQINGRISATKVRNCGSTLQRSGGIGSGDWYWEYSQAVDIFCVGVPGVKIEFFSTDCWRLN